MIDAESRTSSVLELREAFDKSFAAVPLRDLEQQDEVLLIRVAGDGYAIRLSEITGVIAKHAITPIPSDDVRCLGLAGVRGNIIPVFDLAALLGYASHIGGAGETPWMVLCATEEPLALAFSEFEGYQRLPFSAFLSDAASEKPGAHTDEIAQTNVGARPVVNIRRLVANIDNRSSAGQPPQE